MGCISLFESVTGAVATDCIIDNKRTRVIMVVKPGDVGLAIGRHGERIKMVRNMLKRDIEIVEYAADPVEFIKNAFAPARVREVRITKRLDNRKIAVVSNL